jgi:hypothetical protein
MKLDSLPKNDSFVDSLKLKKSLNDGCLKGEFNNSINYFLGMDYGYQALSVVDGHKGNLHLICLMSSFYKW